MRSPFGHSITARLRLFSLIGLVPMLILGGMLLYQYWVVRPEQARQNALQMADEAGYEIEDFVLTTGKVLAAIAHSPYVENLQTKEITSYLQHVHDSYPEYENFTVTDANGVIIAAVKPESIGVNVADRPHVRQVLETGRMSVSDVLISRISGERTIVLSYPIARQAQEGRVIGTVAASFDLNRPALLLPRVKMEAEHRLAVFDRQGQFVFVNSPSGELAGQSDCTHCHSFPTVSGLVQRNKWTGNGYFHVRNLNSIGWSTVVTAPSSQVTGSEERTAWGVLLMVSAILGISLAGASIGGRRLARPILRLSESARRFGAGEQVPPVPLTAGGEIGTLTHSFNAMVKEIGEGRLHQEKQQARLHTLWELDLAISSTLSLSGVLDIVGEEMERHRTATGLAIFLNDDRGVLSPVMSRGSARLPVTGRGEHKLDDLAGKVLGGDAPLLVEIETGTVQSPDGRSDGAKLVCYAVPLASRGRALGVAIFCAPSLGTFSEEQREFLYGVALQTSTAVENARLYGSEQGRVAELEALSGELRYQRDELQRAQEGIVETLNLALQAKDPYTRGHAERVGLICRRIAARLDLPRDKQETLARAARLHDIGKISIPDHLLSKDGKLTPPEVTQFQLHPERSAELLRHVPDLDQVLPSIRGHHERYDGRGYPDGLAGDEIPLGARIIAVADAYDALTTDRPYRKAMNYGDALGILRQFAGTQWDPVIVKVLLESIENDEAIAQAQPVSSDSGASVES